jgi:hypothetical protein
VAEDTDRPGPPPVGSVAEEAARLLDALGGWAGARGQAAREAAGDHESAGDHEDAGDATATDEAGTSARSDGHCAHCGAANGTGTALTCQWCPLCQGLGLLRSVRPETVDRLADLAGALTVALRDVAAHARRGPGAEAGGASPGGGTTPRPGRVQDITIEDEDQGSASV